MQAIEQLAADAEKAIGEYEQARRAYADGLRAEKQMEDGRPAVKLAAILRLGQQPDPRVSLAASDPSKPVKLMPMTEAEKYVELDAEYASYVLNQRNVCHARMRAESHAESARLKASLAIALCKAEMGVV